MAIRSTTMPEYSNTINGFIEAGKDAPLLTYYNFSILQVEYSKDKKIRLELTASNLVTDYLDIFEDNAQKITLTDEDKRKYYYNPDLLSYDLYGTTDLDFIIMLMNGVISSNDFSMPSLKLISKTTLVDLMSRIYNAEQNYLTINREKYNMSIPV